MYVPPLNIRPSDSPIFLYSVAREEEQVLDEDDHKFNLQNTQDDNLPLAPSPSELHIVVHHVSSPIQSPGRLEGSTIEISHSSRYSPNITPRHSHSHSHRRESIGRETIARTRTKRLEFKKKSPCSKLTTSVADFSIGLFKFIPMGLGTGLSIGSSLLLGLAACFICPSRYCSKAERSSNLAEASAFQFKLARIGIINIIAQTFCRAPVYIEEHLCPQHFSNLNGMSIESEGPFKKLQKGYFFVVDKALCITSSKQKFVMEERSNYTLILSKMVFTGSFSEEQVVAHHTTETQFIKVGTKAIDNIIKRNLEETVERLLNTLSLANAKDVLMIDLNNLLSLMVTHHLTTQQQATNKEKEIIKKFAVAVAEKCSVDQIKAILLIITQLEEDLDVRSFQLYTRFLTQFLRGNFTLTKNNNKMVMLSRTYESELSNCQTAQVIKSKALKGVTDNNIINLFNRKPLLIDEIR